VRVRPAVRPENPSPHTGRPATRNSKRRCRGSARRPECAGTQDAARSRNSERCCDRRRPPCARTASRDRRAPACDRCSTRTRRQPICRACW
jgi:hypothetical protein